MSHQEATTMECERDMTALGLVEHWRGASARGQMREVTARMIAGACRGVLIAQGAGWERLDVTTLDVEQALARFKAARESDLTGKTLTLYTSRFRHAVSSYREYLRDPEEWAYRPQRGSPSRRTSGEARSAALPRYPVVTQSAEAPERPSPDGGAILETYRFPFRSDLMVRIDLPRDATAEEIGRLTDWLRPLAVNYGASS